MLKDIAAQASFASIIKQAVQAVREVKKSQILTAELVKIQRKSPENVKTTLKLPVLTRFGSNVHCLKSVLANRQNLSELAISTSGMSKLTRETRMNILGGSLDNDFWNRVQEVLKIMEPIAVMLTQFETDIPNISIVPEAFYKIRSHLDTCLEESRLLSSGECDKINDSFRKL